MKKKFSDEINEINEACKEQLHKLKKQDRKWIFFIPLFIPLLSPALGVLGIICLIIYFICNPKENQ